MSELSNRRRSGHFSALGIGGELQDGETLSCVHCQHTWELKKGSGKVRGFCTSCMGYHCGGPQCWDCVPLEQRLENIEKGRPVLTPGATKIFVPPGIEDVG